MEMKIAVQMDWEPTAAAKDDSETSGGNGSSAGSTMQRRAVCDLV